VGNARASPERIERLEHPTLPPASEFVAARRYLQNVTHKTLIWYNDAFSHFRGCASEAEYKKRIIELREKGISPTSTTSWLRALNAYFHWAAYPNRKCSPGCDHLRLPRLQEEKKLLRTFTSDDVKRLVEHKPKSKSQQRIHSLALLLLDTGLRICSGSAGNGEGVLPLR
jgi:site-specific recombinase XerD